MSCGKLRTGALTRCGIPLQDAGLCPPGGADRPSMLVRQEPETAPLCPQCGDAMRLARKLPPVRTLSGLVVHLCGQCGYVGTSQREPDPPPPKWLQPTRGVRYSLFRAGTRERR